MTRKISVKSLILRCPSTFCSFSACPFVDASLVCFCCYGVRYSLLEIYNRYKDMYSTISYISLLQSFLSDFEKEEDTQFDVFNFFFFFFATITDFSFNPRSKTDVYF